MFDKVLGEPDLGNSIVQDVNNWKMFKLRLVINGLMLNLR